MVNADVGVAEKNTNNTANTNAVIGVAFIFLLLFFGIFSNI